MPSLEIKPTSIALFPTAADRTTLNTQQQYYLSPPLTPFPHIPSYNDNPEHTSPIFPPYHPTLPVLQEMLPHENRQRNLSMDQERFHQHSALQQHPEGDRKEILEHNSVTTYRSGQPIADPARILPQYTAQPHNAVPQPSTVVSPSVRRNKAHVASACVNCKKAHLACDANRPCRRCVSLDKQDSCVDVQHKRRGRPRLKDTTPATGSLPSEHRRPSYLHRHVPDDSWKLQSSPYVRENLRRDYHHHNRGFSQGSLNVAPRHHPYANPTLPTSAYAIGNTRNTSGYFDLPSHSRAYPAPKSPNYYPYSNSKITGPQQKEPMALPHSLYQSSSSARPDMQFSGLPTGPQPLLPYPESSHPSLSPRGSFPSNSHQSESNHYPQRPDLIRTGSSPTTKRRHVEQGRDPGVNDSVKLPSLKDLGVPFH